ncbi:MAG: hypothetical protein KGK11_10515 [Sphingomonadales bacterium]|nr:hypothetical protein [Sphingomonadales bacterium]
MIARAASASPRTGRAADKIDAYEIGSKLSHHGGGVSGTFDVASSPIDLNLFVTNRFNKQHIVDYPGDGVIRSAPRPAGKACPACPAHG